MTADDEQSPATPDEAFALLGNETRLSILRTLGTSKEPIAFSDLHDRVDVRDSGQFNYHLEKLVGHFVTKTEEGYVLRRAGRRVVEAVFSGAVTESPGLERSPVDATCWHCGAPIEAEWRSGNLMLYCTDCPGTYATSKSETGPRAEEGYLGRLPLPPAGLQDRTPDEIVRAAWTWGTLEVVATSAGICPRCSATVEYELRVCEDHDPDGGLCEQCDGLRQVRITAACTNCIYEGGGDFVLALYAKTELLEFLTDHGINLVDPGDRLVSFEVLGDYEETVLATDPFRGRFTFSADDETLALTVDADFEVVDAVRNVAE